MSREAPDYEKNVIAVDVGTRFVKYGPPAEEPSMIENRAFYVEPGAAETLFGLKPGWVAGPQVANFLGTYDNTNLVYPMRNGRLGDDPRAPQALAAVIRYAVLDSWHELGRPRRVRVVLGTAVDAPAGTLRAMFDAVAAALRGVGAGGLVTAVPQPLAVAISEKMLTCLVLESGHGNTQVTPVSMYPVVSATATSGVAGWLADAVAAEVLRDLGWGDRAAEDKFVRMFKEAVGLIPRSLDEALRSDGGDTVFRVPGTRIEVEVPGRARYLIGGVIFEPQHEVYESYYRRGMRRPQPVVVAGRRLGGASPVDAVEASLSALSVELQPVMDKLLLSGGNMEWRRDPSAPLSVTAEEKMASMLAERGLAPRPRLVEAPRHAVWRGLVVYGLAAPDDVEWSWERREGWLPIP